MRTTERSEPDLAACNYALGYADGLLTPNLRRNEPTEEAFSAQFDRGLADASAGWPFDFHQGA